MPGGFDFFACRFVDDRRDATVGADDQHDGWFNVPALRRNRNPDVRKIERHLACDDEQCFAAAVLVDAGAVEEPQVVDAAPRERMRRIDDG